MRPRVRSLVVAAVASGFAFPATVVAAPQGDVAIHHDHAKLAESAPAAVPAEGRHDTMARTASLDDRIKALTADMNMFVGDMKVQTMAKLLTALVERQTMMRDEMAFMHEGMMKMGSMTRGPVAKSPMTQSPPVMQDERHTAPFGEESGAMCAPASAF